MKTIIENRDKLELSWNPGAIKRQVPIDHPTSSESVLDSFLEQNPQLKGRNNRPIGGFAPSDPFKYGSVNFEDAEVGFLGPGVTKEVVIEKIKNWKKPEDVDNIVFNISFGPDGQQLYEQILDELESLKSQDSDQTMMDIDDGTGVRDPKKLEASRLSIKVRCSRESTFYQEIKVNGLFDELYPKFYAEGRLWSPWQHELKYLYEEK